MGISDAVASAGLYANNVYLAPTDNHINIGVASYGALGHVPPSWLPTMYFCYITLELYEVWQQSLISNNFRIMCTADIKISSFFNFAEKMNTVSVFRNTHVCISCYFMCPTWVFPCRLVPVLAPDDGVAAAHRHHITRFLQTGRSSWRPANSVKALRYDTRCYFNVRSKADMNQLNLPHGNDN